MYLKFRLLLTGTFPERNSEINHSAFDVVQSELSGVKMRLYFNGAPLTGTQLNSISGAALTNCRRRRNRTTALLYAMAVSYAILWFPFIILSLYMQFTGRALNKTLDEVVKMISILSTCVNPFLYGYLNTNFNREFKNIFGAIGKFCCRINFINEEMLSRNNRRDVSIADMSRSAWNRLQWKNRVEIYRKRVSLALVKHRRSSLDEDPCHPTVVNHSYRRSNQQDNVLPLTELQFNNAVGDVEI
uniref:G-protein coupled receptors family 1 profile domain-containing protein n=1 Tax=Romanomermis culicivorax TaxID=13658 RepID=A0A915HS58_ROMCU